jgi:hypothetical protein
MTPMPPMPSGDLYADSMLTDFTPQSGWKNRKLLKKRRDYK